MQLRIIVLLFAAVAHAIDITLFRGMGCGGGEGLVCTGMNPDQCCTSEYGESYRSIGFFAIPHEWEVWIEGYRGGSCQQLAALDLVIGRCFGCLEYCKL
jgi:hypothetical protein